MDVTELVYDELVELDEVFVTIVLKLLAFCVCWYVLDEIDAVLSDDERSDTFELSLSFEVEVFFSLSLLGKNS